MFKKRILCIIISMLMILSVIPISASAASVQVKNNNDTITIYFCNNKQWEDVHVYAFYGDPNDACTDAPLGTYPGPKMNFKETDAKGYDVYYLEIPADVDYIKFNDASPSNNRTENIPKEKFTDGTYFVLCEKGDRFWSYTAYNTQSDIEEAPVENTRAKGKVYFKDSRNWGNIHAFTYNTKTNKVPLGNWPGTACKYEGNNIWSIEITDESEYIIFNCPDTNAQTIELRFVGFGATAVLTGNSISDAFFNVATAEFILPDTPVKKTGVKVGDKVYDVKVGDKVTYEILVTADMLFENIQATVSYDSTKLKTESVWYSLYDGKGTNCPNLKYIVYNSTKDDVVKFNASYVKGMDFTSEKVLLTVEFEVIDNRYSEIDLVIEEMTVKGDGTKSYFANSKPVITKGITVKEVLKAEEVIFTDAEIVIGNKTYSAKVGDTVKYEVWLTAERLFENIQATVYYDNTKLKTDAHVHLSYEGEDSNCPNLSEYIYNSQMTDCVKLVSSNLTGYNFRDKKILLTIDFEVIAEGRSEIDLVIEEMTIKGDATESYFANSKPVITEGITVTEVLGAEEIIPNAEILIGDKVYKVKVGDTVKYEVWLTAERLFENIQATVYYDNTKLKTEEYVHLSYEGEDSNCPNLSDYIYNSQMDGCAKIVSSVITGHNFKDKKILLTMEFEVIAEGTSELNLVIEEMCIKGNGSEAYFANSKPVITEGIAITEVLKANGTPAVTYILGDSNGDNKVNVKDSTMIQKSTAGLAVLDEIQTAAADTDGNEKVNVKDATEIQKHIAGMGYNYAIGTEKVG